MRLPGNHVLAPQFEAGWASADMGETSHASTHPSEYRSVSPGRGRAMSASALCEHPPRHFHRQPTYARGDRRRASASSMAPRDPSGPHHPASQHRGSYFDAKPSFDAAYLPPQPAHAYGAHSTPVQASAMYGYNAAPYGRASPPPSWGPPAEDEIGAAMSQAEVTFFQPPVASEASLFSFQDFPEEGTTARLVGLTGRPA